MGNGLLCSLVHNAHITDMQGAQAERGSQCHPASVVEASAPGLHIPLLLPLEA